MSFFLGDTKIDPKLQKGMAIAGAFLTRAAQEAGPLDDTAFVLTFEEKLSLLGEVASDAVEDLGK